jgi:hypothetical protein
MSTISRRLPQTNIRRKQALEQAAQKQASPGPNGSCITPATATRLAAIQAPYTNAYNARNQRQAESISATKAKDIAMQSMRLVCKHFIGVFNYGIERGKYQASERTYFSIAENDSNLPNLSTEASVINLAKAITENDAARVTAGGAPMANPDTAEVLAALNAYTPLAQAHSNAQDALDNAQELLEDANSAVDSIIKKIWDEVETFYNEESPESQRNNAREWGVQYVSVGNASTITFTVTNSNIPAQPVALATITQLDNGVEKTTNLEGIAEFETIIFGTDILFEIKAVGYLDKVVSLSYEEGEPLSQTVVLT